MPASVAAAALISRAGGGGAAFVASCARSFTLRSGIGSVSSAGFSPLVRRHRPLIALLPPPFSSRGRQNLSCLAPRAPSESTPSAAEAPPSEPDSPPLPSDPLMEAAGSLDIRVGRILRAWRHPEAESLFVEEVDVGEAEPRTICSGLVGYVELETLEGARVVVLANLKPRNMRGVKSNGMLLAASDAAHETVELLVAPEGAAPGERVWFGAERDVQEQPEPATPNQVQKKKIWESVQPHLRTDENLVGLLGAHPMKTSAGVVTSRSLKNARIS